MLPPRHHHPLLLLALLLLLPTAAGAAALPLRHTQHASSRGSHHRLHTNTASSDAPSFGRLQRQAERELEVLWAVLGESGFQAGRRAGVQSDVRQACAVEFSLCMEGVASELPQFQQHYIAEAARCATTTCGCAEAAALRCNTTCHTQHAAGSAGLENCVTSGCGLSRNRPAGVRLAEVALFGSGGERIPIKGVRGSGVSPESLADGNPGTAWFDPDIGSASVTFTTAAPCRPESLTVTTAEGDDAGADPIDFSFERLDATQGFFVSMASVTGGGVGGKAVPAARGVEGEAVQLLACVNALDQANGAGFCEGELRLQKTCESDFCPTCPEAGGCDVLCGIPCANGTEASEFRLVVRRLRNPGRCDPQALAAASPGSDAEGRAKAACGLPFVAGGMCQSSFQGLSSCGDEPCPITEVETSFSDATGHAFSFDNAACFFVEQCYDFGTCKLGILRGFAQSNAAQLTPATLSACEATFRCTSSSAVNSTQECAEHRYTVYSASKAKCTESAVCDEVAHVASTTPVTLATCEDAYAALLQSGPTGGAGRMEKSCGEMICEQLASAVPGASTSLCGGNSCCVQPAKDGQAELIGELEDLGGSPKRWRSKYLTCAQLEYYTAHRHACMEVVAPVGEIGPACGSYVTERFWGAVGGLSESCLTSLGDAVYVDKDGVACGSKRMCDRASAFYPRCGSRPLGLQACNFTNANMSADAVQMAQGAGGVCGCPDTHECGETTGRCVLRAPAPETGAPQGGGVTQGPAVPETAVPKGGVSTEAPPDAGGESSGAAWLPFVLAGTGALLCVLLAVFVFTCLRRNSGSRDDTTHHNELMLPQAVPAEMPVKEDDTESCPGV